jgi:hypothetical protein
LFAVQVVAHPIQKAAGEIVLVVSSLLQALRTLYPAEREARK